MIWLLVAFLAVGIHGGEAVYQEKFDDREACEAAAAGMQMNLGPRLQQVACVRSDERRAE